MMRGIEDKKRVAALNPYNKYLTRFADECHAYLCKSCHQNSD